MSTDNPTFKISELPAALHAIDQLLDESGGEITPEVAALLEDYQASLADRVDDIVPLAEHFLADPRRAGVGHRLPSGRRADPGPRQGA